ncbi:DJ-1/PfpI family protein [Exiguobacterium aestuarii]|uniref:DJ-1/PfpI family protein n=1 Tax=Exiguobacterium aestuarii TaxID=273527 RepID=UPI001CD2E921|nr:DJ-1/PfpI family protein [Exiguobacterium aestuarii]MCA0981530.1 DJ-1/PfpI family protein [Exiguobacterium aestuarii]
MATVIKRALGIAPTKEKNGRGFIPSPLGLLLGVDKKSGYTHNNSIAGKYKGNKKILVLCTEERYFKMENGSLFSTGNNVQETAVPLMHLTNTGFDFDVVTPTGSSAVLEEWSIPRKDHAVLTFMKEKKSKFDTPLSLQDMISRGDLNDDSPYVALFLPGGHGSMVGLPTNEHVGTLIRWIHQSDRYMVTVCHGPAALLAASVNTSESHPYSGYKMAIFPDSVDRQSPSLGYLPGKLPWYQGEKLSNQGLSFINKKVEGAVYVDRKLYSGDSPKACDQLGKLVAKALLEELTQS